MGDTPASGVDDATHTKGSGDGSGLKMRVMRVYVLDGDLDGLDLLKGDLLDGDLLDLLNRDLLLRHRRGEGYNHA